MEKFTADVDRHTNGSPSALLDAALDAAGALERWRRHSFLSAHLSQGGALWAMKGQAGVLDDVRIDLALHQEWLSHHPFGAPELRSSFTPRRVELRDDDGVTVESLDDPRDSFAGHAFVTPWTRLQLAYFVGTAMWTYLTQPFCLALPGFRVKELSPWDEDGKVLRRLRVQWPDWLATHSTTQILYFDEAGCLARHDYEVEIVAGAPRRICSTASSRWTASRCRPATGSIRGTHRVASTRATSSSRSTSTTSPSPSPDTYEIAGARPMTTTDKTVLTVEDARAIVAPLYDALNRPAEKDVSALLARACHDDYHSYHTNQDFLTRDQLADVFSTMGETIPDLAWEVVDIHVLDDMVIVRGEATGTPVAEFFGALPTGRPFKTMAIDLFTVRDGKLAKAYHIENWMTAIQQLQA